MKSHLLPAFAVLGFTSTAALALTVPVAEDTVITTAGTTQTIHASGGTAASLPVNAKSTALIQFDLTDPNVVPPVFDALNITSAILRIYVISAKPVGDLTIYRVTTTWTENPTTTTEMPPMIDTTPADIVATIHAADLVAKSFVSVDITPAVIDALNNPNARFGFAIETTGTTKVVLASKEGPGTGVAAELDLETDLAASLIQTFGMDNFFAGPNAGNLTLTGYSNTATGFNALPVDGIGYQNTADGVNALFLNTSGDNNVAIGVSSLYNNGSGSSNSAVGVNALTTNVSGFNNTAFGFAALNTNSSGHENTAVGVDALYSNTAHENTAIGLGALYTNSSGQSNTASGFKALYSNNTGSSNTANGFQALYYGAAATGNTALGFQALFNDAGTPDIPDDGTGNTAIGYQALMNNGPGVKNTAVGYGALANFSTDLNNIAIGYQAGASLQRGGDNIFIGADAGATTEVQTIRIGTKGVQTEAFIAGINGATASGGVAVLVNPTTGQLGTMTSSRRFKTDIAPMGDASDVLLSLKPVSFHYKPEVDPKGIAQFGLIAEEVNEICPDLVVRDDKGEIYTVRYEQVNAMLLNEFLKEHQRVEAQERRLSAQEKMIAEQREELRTIAAGVAAMKGQLDHVARRGSDAPPQPEASLAHATAAP